MANRSPRFSARKLPPPSDGAEGLPAREKCPYLASRANFSAVQSVEEKSLYDRLGGIFAIAAVVNRFSDRVLENPRVGKRSPNPQLQKWSNEEAPTRLPGLKWMRTLWVADISGGPYKFVATRPGGSPLGLENAHCPLEISSAEFDEVARELAITLDEFKVPAREKGEVLAAFSAHKPEVNAGFQTGGRCPVVMREERVR